MNIIPSIDLQNGQCVRLKKGNFNQVTYYSDDPIKVVKQYEAAGVKTIHIVDLDGAKNKEISQLQDIIKLRNITNLCMQVGGGIRTKSTIKQLLTAGINKIVIGSLAATDPNFTKTLLNEFGSENFVLAFDIKLDQTNTPLVAINGWQTESNQSLWESIDNYNDSDIHEILCTDINKDGMLSGPNIELYSECISRYPSTNFQASGGIRDINDLKALSSTGLSSAIIGKALFEKKIELVDALAGVASC